jgi:membrane fusion protein (multidrug efflux system)
MDMKPFQAQVDAAKAQVSKAQAAAEVAKQNLQRVKPLAEKEALSQKDLDDATGNYQSTAATVDAAQAQLTTAELNLSYCTITSPVDGITGAAAQADGTYLNQQNAQLTTVAVLTPMYVNFSLSENEFQSFRDQVEKGQLQRAPDNSYLVEIVLVDGQLFPHTGRVTFTDPAYSAQTGTFLIRATVDNPKGLLKPNQYVRVRVKGATRPNAILVPQRAVLQGAKGHFVWVADKDNKAENRPVTVGDWSGDDWVVLDGLRAGDRVVVDGGLKLSPGAALAAKAYVAGAAAPAATPAKPPQPLAPRPAAPAASPAPAAPGAK